MVLMKDRHIESMAKENGLGVYLRPWEYDVEPDLKNAQGSCFYILKDLSNYLKTDRLTGRVIPRLVDFSLVMAYNPTSKASDLFLFDREEVIQVCEKQVSYESLCVYIDMLRASYQFPVN